MKVLFISTSIPPATDMQTTRNMYLIKAFLKRGIAVDILTSEETGEIDSEFSEILKSCRVFRTKKPAVLVRHNNINKRCKIKLVKKIHNVLVNYYAVPDLYVNWDRDAWEKIQQEKLYGYDGVITSSGSYTAHMVGSRWQREIKKCWVAEYGDPWGLDGFGNLRKKNYKMEQKIIHNCNGFVFTTQSTIEAYKANYPNQVPYALIPCGYSRIIEDSKQQKKDNEKLIFLYTGIAYKRARNLGLVLRAVGERSNRNELLLVGTISDDFRQDANQYSNIRCLGRVPYNISLNYISEADVLVHIGNFGTLQVPGKTYIYLSSQKPILYIRQQKENDPTYEVLSKFGGVVAVDNDIDEIRKGLEYVADNFADIKRKAVERSYSSEIKQYCWSELGDRFADFVMEQIERFDGENK